MTICILFTDDKGFWGSVTSSSSSKRGDGSRNHDSRRGQFAEKPDHRSGNRHATVAPGGSTSFHPLQQTAAKLMMFSKKKYFPNNSATDGAAAGSANGFRYRVVTKDRSSSHHQQTQNVPGNQTDLLSRGDTKSPSPGVGKRAGTSASSEAVTQVQTHGS